ncbi:MAG TPA: tRNA lysidine(34) synthetase TilS [Prolixibacteraceae bacterium]|nr:tRNA lysidine(34) synthetase TilS [Prolixibacteraceae bacterium]
MYSRFLEFIKKEKLFDASHKLLLGVSGGADSVALTHLVDRIPNKYAIAHCNFNLRDGDSDYDERFVKEMAEEFGVQCFLSSFPTREYAAENGVSVEMAARELRYNWFEKIRAENNFDFILVGHHLDDVLETFMLNLTRSTGIRGLTGIKPKAGNILRPLLFATRKDVEQYVKNEKLGFCTDHTNADTKFKRNAIRHHVLPEFEKLNPAFKKSLQQTIDYLWQTEQVYNAKIEEVRKAVVRTENDWVCIDSQKLIAFEPVQAFLFELLRPFGFNSVMVSEIRASMTNGSGQQFFSATHRLVADRNELIITPLRNEEQQQYFYITKNTPVLNEPVKLTLGTELYGDDFRIEKKPSVALVDYHKLSFPLVLRKWKKGEYFRPLGMKGFKKLSDFLIDEKYSIPEKDNTWVLLSDNKIVWVVGKRIDDRFKITDETHKVFRVELL